MRASWLFPAGADRERMLEMDQRIRPARRAAFGVLALGLLASGPWLGWWTLLPLGLAAIVFRTADEYIDRMERPEYGLFGAWVLSQVIIAISVALTGGPEVATMSWFAIPLATLAARFSERGIVVGVTISIALMLGVAFGVNTHAVLDNPTLVIAPLALMVALAILQTVLMHADVATRAEAVIDPLTGMLNRKALLSRAAELTQQSEVTREPVGLIVGDLDHFKTVNDTLGHAVGDAVLRDVAYTLRKELRAFDFAYRIGGEEFVVLVPGADALQAGVVAEQLRAAVESTPAGNTSVTMSFGVGASPSGEPLNYERLFAEADLALYEAKADGRNCVRRAAGTAVAVPA
jgi:diguanylate cyclase (GGDEF)-like protein